MEIFDFAMQMEKDGEMYFRELAKGCKDKGLANILTMLADTEVVHYNILKEMKNKAAPDLPESNLMADVKNIFVKMKEEKRKFKFDSSQSDYYNQAKEIERKAE
ncbi:MAG: ferritin family protein [Planctomycetota bacterium]